MATERTYTIPLRREFIKVQKYKRAKKAVAGLRTFLARHMKTDIANIRLGTHLNEAVWARGIKSPPPRVKVTVTKDDKGIVMAELAGVKASASKKADASAKNQDAKNQEKQDKAEASAAAPVPAEAPEASSLKEVKKSKEVKEKNQRKQPAKAAAGQ
ncbi:50S ribosomal protein L31e [Candidatus Woesearchaeota archaeon]|nr:50S ribosomal protein L31e [Candidatus Woesearchaeota archaeon]